MNGWMIIFGHCNIKGLGKNYRCNDQERYLRDVILHANFIQNIPVPVKLKPSRLLACFAENASIEAV